MTHFNFAPISPLSATLENDDYILAKQLLEKLNNKIPSDQYVEQWEEVFSTWLGVSTSTAWAGGRTALYVAVKTLNLQLGDEVIVPAFTCQAVINAFKYQGVKPVYADIEQHTYGLDIHAIKKVLSHKTKAIMLQYTFGLISKDIGEILDWAKQNKLWIIEDCAHSLGASWQEKPLGTLGDIAIFSSERSKIINTIHGGMCSTNHSELLKRLIGLKKIALQTSHHKTELLLQTLITQYEEKQGLMPSYNAQQTLPQMFPEEFQGEFISHYFEKMSDPIAALALNQFSKREHFQEKRNLAVDFWNRWCDKNKLQKPLVIKDSVPTFLRYPVYVGPENKQNLDQYLHELNILPGVWFTSAAHPTPTHLPNCPIGTQQAAGCINMPTILPDAFYAHFE